MNCFSAFQRVSRGFFPVVPVALVLVVAGAAGCSAPASGSATAGAAGDYRVDYVVTLDPATQSANVTVTIVQSRDLLREMHFALDRVESIEGDGDIDIDDGRAYWRVPADGGRLSWHIAVPHRRGGGYDAWLDESWGLFRIEDLIPRAATRTMSGAESDTRLVVNAPQAWSVITEYVDEGGYFRVERPGRRFSQPTGWVVTGNLGVRRDIIAGTEVTVAAPQNEGVRRIDILALLNWTLPELADILPTPLERLTIVSAGAPMWRGALSAPRSFYLHADRPLISENATSTVLHEVMHVALGLNARRGYDWIIEGFAEFYSIELLRRSGTLTEKRYQRAIADQREWAESADSLCRRHSTGATTALAVTKLIALQEEIREVTDGSASLDDVLAELLRREATVDLELLRSVSADIAGRIPDVINSDSLPGCRTMGSPQTG